MAYSLEEILRRQGIVSSVEIPDIQLPADRSKSLERDLAPLIRYWAESIEGIDQSYRTAVEAQNLEIVMQTVDAAADGGGVHVGQIVARSLLRMRTHAEWHEKKWTAAVKVSTRIDISPLLNSETIRPAVNEAVARHTRLIRGMNETTRNRIQNIVVESYARGDGAGAVAKQLREEVRLMPKRAKLIARDQIGSLTSALDEARQTEAGFTQYRWVATLDTRVRREHRARHLKLFSWKKPPADGHPGRPIRCRCKARGVIPGLDDKAPKRGR